MKHGIRSWLLVIFVTSVTVGCSGIENPAFAPLDMGDSDINVTSDTGTASDPGLEADISANHYLWSYQWIYVDPSDPDGIEFEMVPVRVVSVHWNVLNWLEQGPCTDCFQLVDLTPSGMGTLLADVEISHPFGKPNLTGFDVRGIAIFDASHSFPASALTISDRSLGDGELVNADGYTSLFNPTTAGSGPNGLQGYQEGDLATSQIPNGLLNGFRRHISDDPSNSRNAFYAGDSIVATYEVDMPDGPFVFGYAVDACWAPPISKPVTDPMTDFGPEANCAEPWMVDITVEPLGPGLTEAGGEVRLVIDVWDHQGVDTHAPPLVECPEILGEGVTQGAGWVENGVGYARYEAYVTNTELAGEGEYLCLVSAEANENAGAPEWLDLTAYQTCILEVTVAVDVPPVAKAVVGAPPHIICEDIPFHDDGSFDPDGGGIISYEWDWDIDSVFDETGSEVTHSWDTPGVYYVQFRVTDEESDTDMLDDPLEIIVEHELPTAAATPDMTNARVGEDVTFDASGSQDNDCSGQEIVEYEWHWDSSVLVTAVPVAVIAFTDPGIKEVQLVVTDDEGGQDSLDDPIGINVVVHGWAQTWGGSSFDEAYDIALDYLGNVYVGGLFYGTCDFDPAVGTDPRTAAGLWDGYVSKFDEEGTYQWVRTFGGVSARVRPWAVDCDESGNIYVAGDFEGTIDFDPGTGIQTRTSAGSYDIFLLKLDPAGDFVWVLAMGSGLLDAGKDVVVDSAGNSYLTGIFQDTVDFDPGPGIADRTSVGNFDVFLVKFHTDGVFLWVATWGGAGDDRGYGVALDGETIVYVTGDFHETVNFNPEGSPPEVRTSVGLTDAYLSRINTGGGFEWVCTWGGTDPDYGVAVAADGFGDVFVTGTFEDAVDFDPDPVNSEQRTSQGGCDVFLTTFTGAGDFRWVRAWGGSGYDVGSALAVHPTGSAYAGGAFSGTVDFDPGPGDLSFTSNGGMDASITKYGPTGEFEWAHAWGDTDYDHTDSLTQDSLGNAFAVGKFIGTVDFEPGPGVDSHTSAGLDDAFLARFPSDGGW